MWHICLLYGLLEGSKLKWPQDLVDFLEDLNTVGLLALPEGVNDVLNTDASVCTVLLLSEKLFDEHVVGNGELLIILLEESTLSDEIVDHLLVWVTIGNIILDNGDLSECFSISSLKHGIINSSETHFTQDLLGLRGGGLVQALDSDHKQQTIFVNSLVWSLNSIKGI